jgi:rRNA maturation endonuclease Nob1
MMGFGMLGMLFRGLIPLGVLVLAGFGVAYLAKSGKKNTSPARPLNPTCASCGKPLAAEWKACPYCGKPVEPTEPPAEQK